MHVSKIKMKKKNKMKMLCFWLNEDQLRLIKIGANTSFNDITILFLEAQIDTFDWIVVDSQFCLVSAQFGSQHFFVVSSDNTLDCYLIKVMVLQGVPNKLW